MEAWRLRCVWNLLVLNDYRGHLFNMLLRLVRLHGPSPPPRHSASLRKRCPSSTQMLPHVLCEVRYVDLSCESRISH